MSIAKQDSLSCDLVEIGRANDIVDASFSVDFGVDTCTPPPIVGKEEKDVGRFPLDRKGLRWSVKEGNTEQDAKKEEVHRV